MAERLVVGTIRGRQGERHAVVLPDGRTAFVTFDGDKEPPIGGDVIGLIDPDSDDIHITLVQDVTSLLLARGARIVVSGRSEVTATMLARLLDGVGLGTLKPGTGGIIERTPTSSDPDLAWALGILGGSAKDLGLGLNVIDPIALAKSPWEDRLLRDELLPADAVGERGALTDLRRLMAEGFTPACRRTLYGISRGMQVPSVDFILPFSPFATGMSASAEMSGAYRSELPRRWLALSDARRLSTFRQVALAFAPRYLGRVRGSVAGHVEAAFADAAASIAFLRAGGSIEAIQTFAKLREAGLSRARPGSPENAPATHATLGAVLSVGGYLDAGDVDRMLKHAASLARSHAPSTETSLNRMRSEASDDGVFMDLERISRVAREAMADHYRADCDEVVERLDADPVALGRLSRFGHLTVPLGFEQVFDETVASAGVDLVHDDSEPGISFGDDPWATPAHAGP